MEEGAKNTEVSCGRGVPRVQRRAVENEYRGELWKRSARSTEVICEEGCMECRGEMCKRGARSAEVKYGRGVPDVQR